MRAAVNGALHDIVDDIRRPDKRGPVMRGTDKRGSTVLLKHTFFVNYDYSLRRANVCVIPKLLIASSVMLVTKLRAPSSV